MTATDGHREPNQPPTELNQPDDHAGDTVPTEQMKASVERGHESDTIAVKPILWVGVVIALTCAFAYLVVTVLVPWTLSDEPPAAGNVLRQEKNARSLEEQFADISSTEPDAAVKAPRLEGLQISEPGLGQPNVRPQVPDKNNPDNPKFYHPEDLMPGVFPGLQKAEWKEEGKTAEVPILDAIKAYAKDEKMFPVQKGVTKTSGSRSDDGPSEANGGQGSGRIQR